VSQASVVDIGTLITSTIAALGVIATILLTGNRKIAELRQSKLEQVRTEVAGVVSGLQKAHWLAAKSDLEANDLSLQTPTTIRIQSLGNSADLDELAIEEFMNALRRSQLLILQLDESKTHHKDLIDAILLQGKREERDSLNKDAERIRDAAKSFLRREEKYVARLIRFPWASVS
jgi:hypothetical protein